MLEINKYWKEDYDAIMASSPILDSDQTTMFEPVYYPVSQFEVSLQEETFEDLEMVQHRILSVCRYVLGYNKDVSRAAHTPEHISEMLGLPSISYTARVMKLLHAYGYLDENEMVTQLGQQVLEKDKKIQCVKVKQLIYFDQLNGQAIQLANNIDSHMVFNPEKVSKWAAIIPCYTAGISNDERSNQTFLNWFNEYTMVKHDKSVIHSNTTKIDEVKCLDRKLIRCYLIKNNAFQNPILMVKCYDKLIKQYADRTHWRPLALSAAEKQTEKILEKLGVKTDVTTAGPDYTYALRAIAKQIEERNLKRKQKEEQKNS